MHTMNRILRALCAAAVTLLCTNVTVAGAQAFPTHPVRMVIPFPAGGPLDITGREIAQLLTAEWGQNVIVDNRPGAGGNIGADLVAKAAPDGYTVVMGALSTHAVNPSLYPSMPYDAVKDFAPITMVAITPNVLVVRARFADQFGAGPGRRGQEATRASWPSGRAASAAPGTWPASSSR